jgi:hypothetical protein
MNALAILTTNRSPMTPNLALAREQKLTHFEVSGLFALLPTSIAVIQKLHDTTVATINTPAVAAKRNDLGAMIGSLERRRQTIYKNISSGRSVERSRQPQCPQRVCTVRRWHSPVGARPTRQPLQPEASGAFMEVAKRLKPSDSRVSDRHISHLTKVCGFKLRWKKMTAEGERKERPRGGRRSLHAMPSFSEST